MTVDEIIDQAQMIAFWLDLWPVRAELATLRARCKAPRPAAIDRERLGRIAYEARYRPALWRPAPSWVDLAETKREEWRQIAEAVARAVLETDPCPGT